MTVRAAVTVSLAAALLAVSLPVVADARVQHTDARVAGEVERLETVARSLSASNDLVDDGPPARAQVTVHLPVRSWGASGVETFQVSPPGEQPDVIWQVRGGERQGRAVEGVSLAGPPDGLAVADGGRQRLVLELRRRDGRRTVVARRPTTGRLEGT